MKRNYCEEFDLDEIYRKLISPCKPIVIEKSDVREIFELDDSLRALQEKIAKIECAIYAKR